MSNTAAYDYDRQEWVTGPRAASLISSQDAELLAVLRTPGGQGLLDMVRHKGEPRRLVADVLRQMGACPKIPQGYGVDPGDCACGNCPEARS